MLVQEEKPVYYFPVHFMPQKVTPIEVIALTEAVERAGTIELSELAHLFSRQSSPQFLSILKAVQELGLVQRDGGLVHITDLGLGFARASEGKEGIIRSALGRIEPFKSALELLSKKKRVTAQEVADVLSKKNSIQSQNNEDFVRTSLIEWGIASSLLTYNGKVFELSK
jgi:hypothetical protein